jgi:hypothetical protein
MGEIDYNLLMSAVNLKTEKEKKSFPLKKEISDIRSKQKIKGLGPRPWEYLVTAVAYAITSLILVFLLIYFFVIQVGNLI